MQNIYLFFPHLENSKALDSISLHGLMKGNDPGCNPRLQGHGQYEEVDTFQLFSRHSNFSIPFCPVLVFFSPCERDVGVEFGEEYFLSSILCLC